MSTTRGGWDVGQVAFAGSTAAVSLMISGSRQPTIRVVANGLHLPEGPLELPGGDLLVCEVARDRIVRISVSDGTRSVFAHTAPGPNGAAIGPDGAIYVVSNGGYEWGSRPLADGTIWEGAPVRKLPINGLVERVEPDGSGRTVLYEGCDRRPLLAPNDLVFDGTGGFYFTDYGRSDGPRTRLLGSLYYAAADGSSIREIQFPLEMPNGVALSSDEDAVYVGETTTGRILSLAVVAPGEVVAPVVLGAVPGAPPTYAASCDSMCVDSAGRVLQATIGNGGITVIDPNSREAEHHATGDQITTNCCFGGPGLRTLYLTLGRRGALAAIDDWPVPGLQLAFQAQAPPAVS